MDPDAEALQAASKKIASTIFTIVFTACYYQQPETTAPPLISTKKDTNLKPAAADSVTVVQAATSKKKKKTIYLTFDDGPNKGTRNVMNIVRSEAVPVTLFVVGEHVFGCAEQKNTYDSLRQCRYIEIANHSYTHAHCRYEKFYAAPDSVVHDFARCADSLGLQTGIVRTPGRNIWRTENISSTDIKSSVAAADSLKQHGFVAVGWDVEWHFNQQLNLLSTDEELLSKVDSVFAKGKTKTPNHLVLLAHDQAYTDSGDSAHLHRFIQKLKFKDDYDFDFISNYPNLKAAP
ncbi:MAG TPA: polysaccharide deacetylase family protein [Ferruginibacter sp.]|nr:polysaccharide deacetylase family protein [Ferruginibacter sp.]HMP19417.1 polysaccharide deacetylase family protein [Ferruginibacter sp.]